MENFQTSHLGMLTANGFPASASTLVGEALHLELVGPIPDQSQATVQWALVGRKLFARETLGRVTWRTLKHSNLDTKEGHTVCIEGIVGNNTDYDLSIYGGKIISDNFKPEQEPQFLTFNQDHIVVNRAEILAIHPWDFRLEVHP